MDPNSVVLEISSDEEAGWDDQADKAIFDGNDDYNWIADILDEVNRDDCGRDDGGDDSDEVVVVSEILPRKPRKMLTSKPSSFIDFDDDCVVLDHDPDKPPELQNNNHIDRIEDEDDDSDDIVVVSEKGQVACRDYPHPRHLCIKFPFSSTPNQSHCDQCYCYVCDSLAPCIYWGNGNGSIDHCLATDKNEFWKSERQNIKNAGKDVSVVSVPPMNPVPVPVPVPVPHSIAHNQTPVIRACPVTSSFVVPSIVNPDRNPFLQPRSKFQPGLVSQQLTRTSSCLSTPLHRPVFKRTSSDAFASTTNRYPYSSLYRDNYNNYLTSSLQPNAVNTTISLSSRPNAPFDFPSNFQPVVNTGPFVDAPVLFPPNPVPLSSQAQPNSSLPSFTVPSEASRNESQRSTVDPKFFNGISWNQSQINRQPVSQSSFLEGVSATNEPPVTSGSVDYQFDNLMFNNQPCEPGFVNGSGPFGLREFSPDRGYMGSGTIFDY